MKTRVLGWKAGILTLLVLGLVGCGTPSKEEPARQAANSPEAAEPKPQEKTKAVPLFETVKSAASAVEPAPFEGEGWRSLFSGSDLGGWQEVSFGGAGEVEAEAGLLLMHMGEPFTGLRYTNAFPTSNYEIAFDAMRVMGTDFFCGLTVPVAGSHCSLIVGGWGGSLVGISSVNGMDASENTTTRFMGFEKGRWYRVRMRVTADRIEAWLDKDKIVDLITRNRQISLRAGEIEMCKPLGLASYQTAAAFRKVQWREVDAPADPPPKEF